jgi:hypothetical protein
MVQLFYGWSESKRFLVSYQSAGRGRLLKLTMLILRSRSLRLHMNRLVAQLDHRAICGFQFLILVTVVWERKCELRIAGRNSVRRGMRGVKNFAKGSATQPSSSRSETQGGKQETNASLNYTRTLLGITLYCPTGAVA